MKCRRCKFENRTGAKFCLECGGKLELNCPQCGKELPLEAKFCDQCGHGFEESTQGQETKLSEGERKYVTVIFSDLSGYTAMSEKLDPEEVKEITGKIFGEIARVIDRYEGFIEKYVGDAVMALFGVPEAHEDDPLRAIRAALEIHELVKRTSPLLEKQIGQPLSMHTGINTGLVVTGEVNLKRGTHGVAGDTINVAARLSSLAEADQVLVGRGTYVQAEGYFDFEQVEPVKVKGRDEPVKSYRVLSLKTEPVTLHRLSGLRAELIGRKAELSEIREAVDLLKEGKGRIFAICGDAGTGKSRLVTEFKESLDPGKIQWVEAHAYAYTQNVPYYPLVDLFSRTFGIKEGDRPERIREKLESFLKDLLGEGEALIPYVGSLYSLQYPEMEGVSPEFWSEKLQEAVKSILSALALRRPTVFYLEDLHWADRSFVELLRTTLQEVRRPAVVLCVYRPNFSLFTSHELEGPKNYYREIFLQDLSASEALNMLESLLKTNEVPSELSRFVRNKAEGNPFYLEELVNSLIESDTLVKDNGSWKLTGPITESITSSTIHGIISGRLDRLERETKRVLQEASVIGRSFLYNILRRISELQDQVDRCLIGLERLDLIRTRSLDPDLEYIFKHALTQEVVYNGLLKKDRKEIHERIGRVMERLFEDRLPEFYETLAYHFQRGQSDLKAVDYLIKSGEKSLKHFSVEESHNYFHEALNILTARQEKSVEDKRLITNLIIKWAMVYYYRGDAKGWTDQFMSHKDLAEAVADPESLGMFYAWTGWSFWGRDSQSAEDFLNRALEIGEIEENYKVIGYACNWLTWVYADIGRFDEAIAHGNRAHEISESFEFDHYLFFKSLGGLAYAYYCKGEKKKVAEIAEKLLEYGQKHSNNRCLAVGYFFSGAAAALNGAFSDLVKYSQKACMIALDPCYLYIGKTYLAMGYILDNQIQKAEEPLRQVIEFSKNCDYGFTGLQAQVMCGIVNIAKGNMGSGFKMLAEAREKFAAIDKLPYVASTEHIMGKVFLQMVEKAEPVSTLTMVKNIGFLLRNVPFADKKAESHFNRAIQVAENIGAKSFLGPALLDLGLLHKAKKRKDQARESISKAIEVFEACEAELYLKQAKEALASLG